MMSKYIIKKLIADFDETITEADTIQRLVHAAIETRGLDTSGNTKLHKNRVLAEWEQTVEWYTTQYTRRRDVWLNDHQLEVESRGGEESSLLLDFLKAFEPLELDSIHRVMGGRFLAGLQKEQLRELGRRIKKRAGAEAALASMKKAGVEVEVLSANWSKTLIEGAMAGLCDRVVANCLVFDNDKKRAGDSPPLALRVAGARTCRKISTGDIQLHVVSAADKLRHFNTHRSKTGRTAYIGDSVSDLLAILEADIGILIGENRTMLQTIERFSIPTRRIGHQSPRNGVSRGVVWHVRSWEDVDWLLKLQVFDME
jgi:thiamine phosphate phosphatase / amino-HMP aminohydrolase